MVKFLISQRRKILQSVCQNEVRSSILLTWWNFSFFNAVGFYKASVRMKYGVPHFEADMWSMIHTQTRNFPFVWKYIYFLLNVFLLSEIINLFFIHVFQSEFWVFRIDVLLLPVFNTQSVSNFNYKMENTHNTSCWSVSNVVLKKST